MYAEASTNLIILRNKSWQYVAGHITSIMTKAVLKLINTWIRDKRMEEKICVNLHVFLIYFNFFLYIFAVPKSLLMLIHKSKRKLENIFVILMTPVLVIINVLSRKAKKYCTRYL